MVNSSATVAFVFKNEMGASEDLSSAAFWQNFHIVIYERYCPELTGMNIVVERRVVALALARIDDPHA